MSRTSKDEVSNGVIKNGFDYDLQVWVKDYKVQLAGSIDRTNRLKGQDIRSLKQNIS